MIKNIFVGVILTLGDEVLVLDYVNKKYGAEDTRFPGGKVEPHEDLEKALYRKLEEEIGLTKNEVIVLGKIYEVENVYRDFIKVFFEVRLKEPFPRLRKQFVNTKSGAVISPPYFLSSDLLKKRSMPYHYRIAFESLLAS